MILFKKVLKMIRDKYGMDIERAYNLMFIRKAHSYPHFFIYQLRLIK